MLYKAMDIQTIKKKKRHGDVGMASRLSPASTVHIFKILASGKMPTRGKGLVGIKVLSRIIAERERLEKEVREDV
ncbi:MAG: hypothetical protein AAGL66_16705 [Pseudomonadota bacterium]